MKKRFLLFSLLFILLIGFVIAQDNKTTNGTDTGKTQEEIDAEKLQETIDKVNILDSEGNVNVSYRPFRSKAEERIDKINEWLKSNASWLRAIFGMVPEISWLFAWTIYFLLLGFLWFFLNHRVTFFWFGEKFTWIPGMGLFLILMIFGAYASLAGSVLKLIRTSMEAAWYLAVLFIIAFVLVAVFSPKLLQSLQVKILKWRERQEMEKGLLSGQQLTAQAEAIRNASR